MAPPGGTLGAYYYQQDHTDRQRSIAGPLPVFGTSPGALFQDSRLDEIKNKSIFGSLSVDLSDQWTLELEARYAKDEKSMQSGQRDLTNNASDPVFDQLEYTSFTPRITMAYQPTDNLNLYF